MTLNISHTGDELLRRIGYYPCESKEQNEYHFYYKNEEEGLVLRIGPDRVQLWNGNTVVGIPVELFIPIVVKLKECLKCFDDVIEIASDDMDQETNSNINSNDNMKVDDLYEERSVSINICTPRLHNIESDMDQISISVRSSGLSMAETKLMVKSAIENLIFNT